jgi:hypothetical protein
LLEGSVDPAAAESLADGEEGESVLAPPTEGGVPGTETVEIFPDAHGRHGGAHGECIG